MSIQQNFPGITPTLSLNFARSKKLDPRITFTRTSSATRVNETGLVEVVPANAPRFDHSYDPVSGSVKSLGLLIEESRSNLLNLSEEFDNWFKIGTKVTQNNIVSPSNQSTADLISVITSGGSKSVSRDTLTTIGVTYTLSVFAKSANSTTFSMGLFTNAFIGLYNFNLTGSGSIITQSAGISASITPYPNGWYRCSLTATTNGSGTTTLIYPNTTVNSIGDSIYIWGAQVEEGSFPTSYIPTTSTTATRTADNASITGTNFSDFYNPSEGTINTQFSIKDKYPANGIVYFNINQNINDSLRLFYNDGISAYSISNRVSGVQNVLLNLGAFSSSQKEKISFSYKLNDFSSSRNGLSPVTTSSGTLSSNNRLDIGVVQSGLYLNGHIAQLTYYPKRLTNDQLINLTK